MKILLAPSKTKTLQGCGVKESFVPELEQEILTAVRALSPQELAKAMKLNEEKGLYWHDFYAKFKTQPEGKAIESYNGLVFKRLNYQTLSMQGKVYCQEHLRILSGFYGIVEPEWNIADYRLDLVDKIFTERGKNLTKFWQPRVTAYFAEEDWLLNLASKEYSSLVMHPRMVTVEFLQEVKGKLRQGSTASKEMRGSLARYCCEHGVTEPNLLPRRLGDYLLQDELPEEITESVTVRYYKL